MFSTSWPNLPKLPSSYLYLSSLVSVFEDTLQASNSCMSSRQLVRYTSLKFSIDFISLSLLLILRKRFHFSFIFYTFFWWHIFIIFVAYIFVMNFLCLLLHYLFIWLGKYFCDNGESKNSAFSSVFGFIFSFLAKNIFIQIFIQKNQHLKLWF